MTATAGTRAGAWWPGDPVGHREFVTVEDFRTESGAVLDVTLAYETWGRFRGDNAVLVEHALTGDSHVTGAAGPGHPSPGWWDGLVGPGRAVDTDRFFVVAPNALGGCQGSTGPSSPGADGRAWGARFPAVTMRDLVRAEAVLADRLGVGAWAAVLGGSMGGMRALEWAATFPERVRTLVPLATCAAASPDQIAWSSTQIRAIEADPDWHGGDYYGRSRGPDAGLGVARRMAQLSYRSAEEFDTRFGRRFQDDEDPYRGGRFAVESYLDHHARKLVGRFDAGSYVVLSRAMNGHDVGRGRGGVDAALAGITAETFVVGVASDRLYPVAEQERLVAGIPGAHPLRRVESPYGHDGFLIESGAIGPPLRRFLDAALG